MKMGEKMGAFGSPAPTNTAQRRSQKDNKSKGAPETETDIEERVRHTKSGKQRK